LCVYRQKSISKDINSEVMMPESAQETGQNKTTSNTAPVRKNGPRGEVFLYPNWCKGCHICVDFCPTGTLAMNGKGEHPTVAHPENCTACHFCDTHCPDMAILVRKIK